MQELTIKLADDLADAIRERVAMGAVQDLSTFVEDSVRRALSDDQAFDRWMRDEAIPGYHEYLADPSQAIPGDKLLETILDRKRTRG